MATGRTIKIVFSEESLQALREMTERLERVGAEVRKMGEQLDASRAASATAKSTGRAVAKRVR